MHTEFEQRIVDLEAQIEFLANRHSALEYVTEQILSNLLYMIPGSKEMITQMLDDTRPAWTKGEEFEHRPTPGREAAVREQTDHILRKIETRLVQGPAKR